MSERPPYLTIEATVRCAYCGEVVDEREFTVSEGVEYGVTVGVCDCQTRKQKERVRSGLFTPGSVVTRTKRDPAPKHVVIEVTDVEVFEDQ